MVGKLELAERKWARKVRAARDKWVSRVKSADALDAYVQGISDVTGLDPATVRASMPARNYAEFQRNADAYASLWIERVSRAAEKRKWSKGFVDAFRAVR